MGYLNIADMHSKELARGLKNNIIYGYHRLFCYPLFCYPLFCPFKSESVGLINFRWDTGF
jgi:hypothetical protein